MQQAARDVRSRGNEERICDKTLKEWEGGWRPIGELATADVKCLSSCVGLYRARCKGKDMYVGRALEYDNGELRKRLSDYIRDSDSARKHPSGQLMNKFASDLDIEILITETDSNAAEVAKKLEKYFVGLHSPDWNKRLKP